MGLLKSFLNISHSAGDGNEREDFPQTLKHLINLYDNLQKATESTNNPTQSAKNRIIQDKVVGSYAPLGPNTNAPPRSSVRKDNEKKGIALANRSNDQNKLPGISTSVKKITPNEKLTKKKPKNMNQNVEGVIDNNKKQKINLSTPFHHWYLLIIQVRKLK